MTAARRITPVPGGPLLVARGAPDGGPQHPPAVERQPNLYICDGSSFATGGVVNPTSTVTALALRCARHIASKTGKLLSHPD